MFRRLAIPILAILAILLTDSVVATASAGSNGPPLVLQVRLENESISPITARFLERAIEQAERERAACLVIILDTPGGLVESTRSIVKRILRSEAPVVVFVAPAGARAASAGMFITLAGHVAAMAPGANIGAAHPVQIGGLPISPQPDEKKDDSKPAPAKSPAEEKSVNDTVAWARSLAELRGRNADWAARAVRESASATAAEAVREQAVDLLAQDVNDLLAKIDGRDVTLPSGAVRLNTAGATVHTVEMWWGERVLAVVSNPNMAFLLLVFGFYGVLFELYTPGWGVAGTLGAICLVLAFLGLAVLPINYVGLALIAIALAMFTAEVFVTSYGALTLGGIICLMLGGMILVDSPAGFVGVSLKVVVPVTVSAAVISLFLVSRVVKAHRGGIQTGSEALIGMLAVAEEDFAREGMNYGGLVRTHGELWKALSPAPVAAGQAVEVQDRQGLALLVQAVSQPSLPDATGESTKVHDVH
jgi:membrane-bound serine protease (ClpP class)